ncbi:glutamate--tRNA ligase [Candidatus Hecatella orcuttiae]|uniref:glutamate--tRNA ligase n=1 Tax=Candidatus Hecatella orcuttiae TaxID=1935119 RepID=UPI002867C103|nr:glutamate--tRNA ligase [Candidatus Hecatella orcuttiae]
MSEDREHQKLESLIRKYTILNAYTHRGKAHAQAVLSKVLGEMPQYKKKALEVLSEVKRAVEEVNRLTLQEQKKILEETWPELLEAKPKVEERALPPLPEADKYPQVVTRFSPNPDCVLHMGSARAIILSWSYARMYHGVFLLRFEDTDPHLKKPSLEFYDSIREDLLWLGCKWDREYIQSQRLGLYYIYAKKLLEEGKAYVCTCQPEVFRRKISARQPCPCREQPPETHLHRWEKMLDGGFGEGEAVVRVKTDLSHPNPAVRDWPALRIVDTGKTPHPLVGDRYRVWPLYNFSSGLDDHLLGVTHVIRGKEHLTNEQRQRYLYHHLGWDYPTAIHYGRLKIEGVLLSKSKIKLGVEQGVYEGYSDPRLATFAALRRRGIKPQAIEEMILEIGLKPVDITLSWDTLYSHNRRILDPVANRYFFVAQPFLLEVSGAEKPFKAVHPLHPEHPERGFRAFEIKPDKGVIRLLVSGNDRPLFTSGAYLRLKNLFNIQVKAFQEGKALASFTGTSHEEAQKGHVPIIHYLPAASNIPSLMVMPDGSRIEGFSEEACKGLKVGEMVQLERWGFARVDAVAPQLTFFYAHK